MDDSRERVNPPRDENSLSQDPRRLKWRRVAAGLTLRGAAGKARIHWTTIGKLETGDRSADPRTLAALAKVYGCKITDLMPPEPASTETARRTAATARKARAA